MNAYIRLHAADDVLIARAQLLGGTVIEGIAVKGLIPPGHKIATRAIAMGEPVRRYNQIKACLGSGNLTEGDNLKVFNIQDTGGTAKTVEKGIDLINAMLPRAHHPRPAVRRLGWLLGHQRQPGFGCCGRLAGRPWWHGHFV